MESGTLPLDRAEALVSAEFGCCVIKGVPCPAAQTIYIDDPKSPRLSCAHCGDRQIAPVEASRCTVWLKLISPADKNKEQVS